MSLALIDQQRLVAPLELVPMEPPALSHTSFGQLFGVAPPPSTPSFVHQARDVATAHASSATAFARLAQAEQSIGQHQAAIEAAHRALKLAEKTGDTAAAVGAVQVLAGCDRENEAEQALERLKVDGPLAILHAGFAARRGAFAEAIQRLEGLDLPQALGLRAWIALRTKDFTRAISLYREALKRGTAPTPSILVNLGYAHAALGARHKAITETKRARELSPANRLIALNLIGFFVAGGDYDSAFTELKRIRELWPHAIDLSFAEADVHASAGDLIKAQRVLQRARTNLWAFASPVEQAELQANLVYLSWRIGKRTREDAARTVIEELERCAFESLDIADLLPSVLNRPRDAARVERVIKSLEKTHPDNPLSLLRLHLHLLRYEYESATDVAFAWAQEEIFHSGAAGGAVYLLAVVRGDYDAAIRFGRQALKRLPSARGLRNNLAYALVLKGEVAEARDLIHDPGDSVHLTATRALIDLAAGDVAGGMTGYKRAHDLALQRDDSELALRVLVYEALALQWLNHPIEDLEEEWRNALSELPEGWDEDPHLVLLRMRAEREGKEWPTAAKSVQRWEAESEQTS